MTVWSIHNPIGVLQAIFALFPSRSTSGVAARAVRFDGVNPAALRISSMQTTNCTPTNQAESKRCDGKRGTRSGLPRSLLRLLLVSKRAAATARCCSRSRALVQRGNERVEPAPGAAAAARMAGLDVTTGYLRELPAGAPRTALAFAVNVIEHTASPLEFLRALASHGDRVAIVCPDATTEQRGSVRRSPSLATSRTCGGAVCRCGTCDQRAEPAPRELGFFQIAVGVRGSPREGAPWPSNDLTAKYLTDWRSLDDILTQRIGKREAVAFGAGEAAGLLRAYAPLAWSRVVRCAVDAPDTDCFGDLAVVDAQSLKPSLILLAVRPAVQSTLEATLQARVLQVVRWDDIVPR